LTHPYDTAQEATMSIPNSDRGEMNDIIDHLNAVLDEDESAALGAKGDTPGIWDDKSDPATWIVLYDASGKLTMGQERHIARQDPAATLRKVAALRQVINDYRMSDRACMDHPADPEYATIRAGRDAFKSVLHAYAIATGWEE
jgi:hypothetical protein